MRNRGIKWNPGIPESRNPGIRNPITGNKLGPEKNRDRDKKKIFKIKKKMDELAANVLKKQPPETENVRYSKIRAPVTDELELQLLGWMYYPGQPTFYE